MTATVDHLVVAAPSLAQGVRWCEAVLGVTPGHGGQHPLMGTHNHLFDVSSEAFPRVFLEVIAIDPAAEPPRRSRWFGLDDLDFRDGPRLLHVVARSTRMAAQRAAWLEAGMDIGEFVVAARDTPHGRLSWQLSVRDDGRLLAGGALPTLIDWGGTPHPTTAMPASGVALRTLTLRGLPTAVAQMLGLSGADVVADAGPAITATFDTPRGRVSLHSK